MSVSINGTGGITFADASTQSTGGYTGFRNRIINGAMMIDQRNAGASFAVSGGVKYVVDRFYFDSTVSGVSTSAQQVSDAPTGFGKSLKFTVTTGGTAVTSNETGCCQVIEANNISDLGWGTASAAPITLSFWVKSSVAGTFGFTVYQNQTTNRSYVSSYTINAANTWEYKTITIIGDTSYGIVPNNGVGLRCYWDLGVGPSLSGSVTGAWSSSNFEGLTGGTKLISTSGATFYITGVQLEKGSVATPFEFRQYGTELALCQRYFQYFRFVIRFAATSANNLSTAMPFVAMRTIPTATRTGNAITSDETGSTISVTGSTGDNIVLYAQNSSNIACGGYGTLSAEL